MRENRPERLAKLRAALTLEAQTALQTLEQVKGNPARARFLGRGRARLWVYTNLRVPDAQRPAAGSRR